MFAYNKNSDSSPPYDDSHTAVNDMPRMNIPQEYSNFGTVSFPYTSKIIAYLRIHTDTQAHLYLAYILLYYHY